MPRIAQRDTNVASMLVQTSLDALTVARQLTDATFPQPDSDQLVMLEEALDHARQVLKEFRRKTTPIELKGQRG